MDKLLYKKNINEHLVLRENSLKDENRLQFHLMPNGGWLNDPNGLFSLSKINHIYYQYSPFTTKWGLKCWGHYTTKDWINYKEEEIFLFPDSIFDKDGAYSGSAFVENNEINFFYTGNIKYIDKDYDYILEGREQNTIKITSKDGFVYSDKKLILSNNDYPKNMSKHVRDPKIIKFENEYYMILGARTVDNQGCTLIYISHDLDNFNYHMCIKSNENLGYMWECPDLFIQDNEWFLIFCPQFISNNIQNDKCAYLNLSLNLKEKTYSINSYHLLDYGFDFYAPQSYIDENSRRILIGWMGIPDSKYLDVVENKNDWIHALSIPKEIIIKNHKILQQPLKELNNLRDKKISLEECSEYKTFELNIFDIVDIDLQIGEISITFNNNLFSLDLSKCGMLREIKTIEIDKLKNLKILKDTTSIEIFINDGEFVLTSRCYNTNTFIKTNSKFKYSLFTLKKFNIQYYYEK